MTSANGLSHETVLLEEAVAQLNVRENGVYVDATFGRGGHSQRILQSLGADGRLLAIDKDPDAIRAGDILCQRDARFAIQRGSFGALAQHLDNAGCSEVDGVLADLGVSSPQLDDAQRGFSFMRAGPLDMRMDPDVGESAAEWLNRADEKEIADVIFRFGEERHSRRIARAVVRQREETPITTTEALASLVADAVPGREKRKHPATRTFQGIRIFINRELEDLEVFLASAADRLALGGRLVVISFHSLEDRMVKRFMRDRSRVAEPPKGVPVRADAQQAPFRVVGKAIRAGQQEQRSNARARSAIMRTLERVAA